MKQGSQGFADPLSPESASPAPPPHLLPPVVLSLAWYQMSPGMGGGGSRRVLPLRAFPPPGLPLKRPCSGLGLVPHSMILPWDRASPFTQASVCPHTPRAFLAGALTQVGRSTSMALRGQSVSSQRGKFPARVRAGPVWYPYMQGTCSSCSASPPLSGPATLDTNPEPGQGATVLRDSLSPVPVTPRSRTLTLRGSVLS